MRNFSCSFLADATDILCKISAIVSVRNRPLMVNLYCYCMHGNFHCFFSLAFCSTKQFEHLKMLLFIYFLNILKGNINHLLNEFINYCLNVSASHGCTGSLTHLLQHHLSQDTGVYTLFQWKNTQARRPLLQYWRQFWCCEPDLTWQLHQWITK